jgi:hypothetical protein
LWKEAIDQELDIVDRAGIWNVVDKVKEERKLIANRYLR